MPLLVFVKVTAVVAILWRFSVPLADLAYAGMLFHLLLAAIAHIGVRNAKEAVPAVIGLVLLVTSFVTQNAARDLPSPYAAVAEAAAGYAPLQK